MENICRSSGSRLGHCHRCKEKVSKYKCPRCSLGSCSLSCVMKHKTENNCNGIRNKVALISKSKMDNLTLLSDYRFLEEIDHKLEDGLRNPIRKTILKKKEIVSELPFHLKKLNLEAKKRGTHLEFMPKYFSVHQINSTRFSFHEKKIRWHIKWIFPQAECTFIEKSVDENLLIADILQKYMEPPYRTDDEPPKISAEDSEKLLFYQSASYRRIAVLLHSTQSGHKKKYVKMFLSKSMKDNFANKTIVEHPVFSVVLKDHLDFYIDHDESEDEEEAAGNLEPFVHAEKTVRSEDCTNIAVPSKEIIKGPRVKRKDGGLSFFNSVSDSDSHESD